MAKKIYLSPSDQYRNVYAYGNTTEKEQCERISLAAKSALERCGFEVKLDIGKSLEERVSSSNAWKADLHVPIHTNAYNGVVSGTRMFYYAENSKGKDACLKIFNVLAPITPGNSESIKAYPTLYELRATTATAVYVEVDFHDVISVAKWIIENTTKIGEAICQGICEYYNVAYKSGSSTITSTTSTVTSSTKLYRVIVDLKNGQVGAFQNKANAEKLVASLRALGITKVEIKED